MDMTIEDVAIRAEVLARFAKRVWGDPQYKRSETARSPMMALYASYRSDRANELADAAIKFFRYHSGG